MTSTDELERPAWGVWVDYKIAPPGSYACLVSRFMDNRWTDPEPQWMPAQLRPQLHGEVRVMPYLMPNDPLATVNALPELLALREENERLRNEFPTREKQAFVMGLNCAAKSVRETSGGSVVCEQTRLLIADSLDHAVETARAALNQEPGQ